MKLRLGHIINNRAFFFLGLLATVPSLRAQVLVRQLPDGESSIFANHHAFVPPNIRFLPDAVTVVYLAYHMMTLLIARGRTHQSNMSHIRLSERAPFIQAQPPDEDHA
jgi:hypothetical protein